jgi:hypothetical protein
MMTCKEVATLVSMGELDEAPPARHVAVRLHFMMCRHCRTFSRQLRIIGRAARSIADDVEREPTSTFESRILDRLGS